MKQCHLAIMSDYSSLIINWRSITCRHGNPTLPHPALHPTNLNTMDPSGNASKERKSVSLLPWKMDQFSVGNISSPSNLIKLIREMILQSGGLRAAMTPNPSKSIPLIQSQFIIKVQYLTTRRAGKQVER